MSDGPGRGRPPLTPGEDPVRLTVMVPKALMAKLDAAAAEAKVRRSDLVRAILAVEMMDAAELAAEGDDGE